MHFRELFVCGRIWLSVREKGRVVSWKWSRDRTRRCLISGVLSHTGMWWRDRWYRGEGAEKTDKMWVLRRKALVVSFLLQGVFHRTNTCRDTYAVLSLSLYCLCLCGGLSLSYLRGRWSKNPVIYFAIYQKYGTVGAVCCQHSYFQRWRMWSPTSSNFTPPTMQSLL